MDPAYMMHHASMMHLAGIVPAASGLPAPGMHGALHSSVQMPAAQARFVGHSSLSTFATAPISDVVDSAVSTAPQTPHGQNGLIEPEISSDSGPAVITVKTSDLLLVKVPDFISDKWLAQAPGTLLGVLTREGNPRRMGISFPRSLGLPVSKIQPCGKRGIVNRESSETILSAAAVGTKQPWPLASSGRIEGQIVDQTCYLPDVSDPAYRSYLETRSAIKLPTSDDTVKKTPIVLSAEESAKLHQKLVEDVSEDSTSKRLFHYFGSSNSGDRDGGSGFGAVSEDEDSTSNVGSSIVGGNPNRFRNSKKRRLTQLSTEEGQAKLFRFFESKGNQPASMKEVVNFLGTTQTFTKQLLDQIAEPVRERQGKRVSFILKAEYRGCA
eukprot:Gregarina_sp_Poly_1__10071@NODE_67_length_16383_cov_69_023903_g57_i0_p3_GENE_NODE_67_length_16383_cov_69_023903_g57_i0NODE_67_length_16383_cov_69_023903_g57_i0_p3_ORF_typecomplete_len382_score51_90TFIIF_beta/PF02270_15/0_014TFIIF_beta_N/PF17683_1/0_08TFIIF_beta_N/PF17683_1/8_4e03_NODE_67_length_16383_cov_69_023903_g57_i055356680